MHEQSKWNEWKGLKPEERRLGRDYVMKWRQNICKNYFQSFGSVSNSDMGDQPEGEVEEREFVRLFVCLQRKVLLDLCVR